MGSVSTRVASLDTRTSRRRSSRVEGHRAESRGRPKVSVTPEEIVLTEIKRGILNGERLSDTQLDKSVTSRMNWVALCSSPPVSTTAG